MNIMELGAIGELVGGVAVLVTLIYLVVQVRQGNANARATSRQVLIDTWAKTMFDLGHDRELLRIAGEGFRDFEALSEDDQCQFTFLMSQYVANIYNGVLLYDQGLLDQKTLDHITGLLAWVIVLKGGTAWWKSDLHPPEVKAYVADYLERKGDSLVPADQGMPYFVREWGPAPEPS